MEYDRDERAGGTSKYSFFRLCRLAALAGCWNTESRRKKKEYGP